MVLLILLVIHLPKTKKEFKNLCRQEIQILYIKIILTKLVFNMIWLMINAKTWLKESDKVLKDKPFKIASNSNYDGYQRRIIASMFYKVFNKNLQINLCQISYKF